MNSLPDSTGVVVVGAGPTGLTLGAMLAAERVPFVLVDRLPEGANTSRAAVVHARTLEVLERLEVSDRLRSEGLIVPRFAVRDRDRVLATIGFERLPTRYPHTLMISQARTETILLDRLRELGAVVNRPLDMIEAQQGPDAVRVSVAAPGKPPQDIRARYLVGTDGMHSRVREIAGIGFRGDRYELSFALADVRMDWGESSEEGLLFVSPEGMTVVAPLPGGIHRVVATLDEAPEHPGVPDIQRLFDTRGPVTRAARVHDLIWSSRFRVHHRLADRYRSGRILLAGDAAHVHSPAGGQGMNTGIQDAMALGQALAEVFHGPGDDRRLNQYEQVRRPIAQRVVALTDRMTRMATLRAAPARAMRNAAVSVIGRVAPIRHWLALQLSGLSGH